MADCNPIKRTRIINDIGIGMSGIGTQYLKDIRIYPKNGSVQIWVEVIDRGDGRFHEAMQYLRPEEAMQFAKAFERCAIQALRERTE